MSTYSLSKQTNDSYYVIGDLTFFTLNKKTIGSFDFLKSAKDICIDLEKVSTADSAGLALLIEWIKQSKLRGTSLTFENIPQQLLTLAKLSSFEINEYCR
jgi:phospholipid transport system transporter-binding protein